MSHGFNEIFFKIKIEYLYGKMFMAYYYIIYCKMYLNANKSKKLLIFEDCDDERDEYSISRKNSFHHQN